MAYADIVAAILNAMEAAQDAFEAANKAHNYVSIMIHFCLGLVKVV